MNFLKTKTGTNQRGKSYKAILPFLAVLSLFFSACLDDDDKYGNDPQTIVAAIASINASPSAQGYDFYTDANTIVNTEQDFKYGNQIRYKRFYSGNREFAIFKAGTASDPVLDSVLSISNGQYQTLFLAGTSDHLNFVLLNDGNLEKAAAGKAKIRFVNLTPDAGELNLGIKDASGLLASSKKFKEFSDFQETDAGTLSLEVTDASGTVLKEFSLDAKDGFLYTVYSSGFLETDNTDFKFKTDVVDHLNLGLGN